MNPRNGKVARSIDAAALLAEIAQAAWASGDPGVIFLDAVNRANPTPALGALEATNPCGELPLLPNESCTLGSLRLDAFVQGGAIDWPKLDAAVDLGVRFLDDVIEVSRYPFPEIAAATRGNRKIGLGVMGFADLLVELGVAYDAPEAVSVAERVMARIAARAQRASAELAEERGAFPNFARSRLARAGPAPAQRDRHLDRADGHALDPRRTAPAGSSRSSRSPSCATCSTERGCRRRTPASKPRCARAGADREDVVARVRRDGRARGVAGVPPAIQRLFPTAADVAPAAHLDVQEAFQKHVDNAVSKTINLPASATARDVRAIYTSAWRRGLKGVTVFREGCKDSAVLVRGDAHRARRRRRRRLLRGALRLAAIRLSSSEQREAAGGWATANLAPRRAA